MPNNPHILPSASRTIEIVAFPDIQILDLTGPLQVFACANELTKSTQNVPPYRLKVVSAEGGAVQSSAGLPVLTEPLSDTISPLDTILLPGGMGVSNAARDAHLTGWIKQRAMAARRIVSICSGAFLAAACGLLDNRRAVTHWERCEELADLHPDVHVEYDPIFIQDGPIWTSAGVTAGIDLCLALVEDDLGREVALAIARDLVVYLKRSGGQSQYSAVLSLQASEVFSELHSWIIENLDRDLSITVLAAQCGMSERNFARKYVSETGITPARGVERLRTETARSLLADTALPIKSVAVRCGFASEEGLRRSFSRAFSMSPNEYRKIWSSGRRA